MKYLESGYLTSSFRETVKSEKSDPHALIVTYEIHEGPRVTTSSVITLGRLHTKQVFIDRATKFTSARAAHHRRHADRGIAPLLARESSTGPRSRHGVPVTTQTQEDVLVKVHEARRNTLTYGFGFEVINRGGSLPSGTVAVPGLASRGSELQFRNQREDLLGTARIGANTHDETSLAWPKISPWEPSTAASLQRASANFQNPELPRHQLHQRPECELRAQQRESDLHRSRRTGWIPAPEAAGPQEDANLILRYSFSETQITNLLIPELVPQSDLERRLSTVSATYSHDTRDNPLNATRGIYQSVEIDLNPTALGSSVSFRQAAGAGCEIQETACRSIIWANSLRAWF